MTKSQFLTQLERHLAGLPKAAREEMLEDYRQHFAAGEETGRSDTEIAASLGDPAFLARQLKASYQVEKAESGPSTTGTVRAVLAIAGLGFFNLVFIAGPFFGLLGVLIGLGVASIGITLGGAATVITCLAALINPSGLVSHVQITGSPAAGLFLGLALICLGLILTIGCGYLARAFYRSTLAYLKLNLTIVRGKEIL